MNHIMICHTSTNILFLAGQLNTWELCDDRIEGWYHSPTAHITPAAIQAKTPMSSTVAVKRKCLEDFSANDNLVTVCFFIAMSNVHWTLQPTCSHLGPAVRTLHIYGARAKHPTKKQVTLWRIILNTWEQHTDAGPVQGLEAGQAVEACTAAVEIFFKLLFFLFLLCSSLSSFLDPSRSISKLAPGKVSIVFLQKLPDQDTPVVTSHGLGRVGVGLPCCLCLSFPLISATT